MGNDAPVRGENASVNSVSTPVREKNTPVTTPVGGKNTLVTLSDGDITIQAEEGGAPGSRKEQIEEKILTYCVEPHGILDIAEWLGYKEKKTVRKYLAPLLEQGRIAMTIPDKPNSRLQKYITIH